MIVNLQGSLGDPNPALAAASAGTLASLGRDLSDRIGPRALADAEASGVTAVFVTVGHVVGSVSDDDAWTQTVADLDRWDRFIASRSEVLGMVTSAEDVLQAARDRRIGVLFGFQNLRMLGADAGRVAAFADRGVRVMQLTYNDANAVGAGCLVPLDPGLSPLGRSFIEAMAAAHVLPDLSHAGDKTLHDALAAAPGPVLVSHSGCRALAAHPRNIDDRGLRAVAQCGGLVGIYAMPFLRAHGQPMLADWVRHIEHAWQCCGQDHVGIGTDGPITAVDDVPAYMHFLAEDIAERRRLGVSAAGEDPAVALFLPDACGPGQFCRLVDALALRGHPASRIDKLMGGNALRLLREVVGR
jgi:membrane dipeptidase